MSGENPTLNMNGEEAKETDGIDDDDDDWFLKASDHRVPQIVFSHVNN